MSSAEGLQYYGWKSLREPDVKGHLLVECVSRQPSHQINKEIRWVAMARMFDLQGVFQLIIDNLNNRAFTQHEFVK